MTWQQLEDTYRGKRVFPTGHTGFKGAWMLQLLHALGADVKGYSPAPGYPAEAFYSAFCKPANHRLTPDASMHEAALLMLNNDKIKAETGWMPRLNADQAIQWTAEWYADNRPAAEQCKTADRKVF